VEGKSDFAGLVEILMVSQGAFGVPYSVCGCCPGPDEAPEILAAAKSRSPEGGPTPLVNPRPDLVFTEDEDADASHPSEHSAAVGDPNSRTTQHELNKRIAKAEGRLNRAKEVCPNPERDPWVQLQAERNARRDGHTEAFTDPTLGATAYYPYWGITMFTPNTSVT